MRILFRLLTFVALALAGFSDADAAKLPRKMQEAVNREISQYLRDPYSARYTFDKWDWPTGKNISSACGTVNSKNGFGGYAGRAQWFVTFQDDSVYSLDLGTGDQKDWVRHMCSFVENK